MISVENLSKSFGQKLAVDDISFEVKKGEVLGFLGPNGAGKSTTMRMVTGYLPPTAGEVVIDGVNVQEDPICAKQKIGYLPVFLILSGSHSYLRNEDFHQLSYLHKPVLLVL